MSDYQELARRLRKPLDLGPTGLTAGEEAAAAIESLEAELAAAHGKLGELAQRACYEDQRLQTKLAAARDESAALREALRGVLASAHYFPGMEQTMGAETVSTDALSACYRVFSDPSAAGSAWRVRVEKEARATFYEESRVYLAGLCGMKAWLHLRADHTKAVAQAAQLIVNAYADRFDPAARRAGGEPT